MRLLRSAESSEHRSRGKRQRDRFITRACDEREERDAGGAQHPGEEEPPPGDVAGCRPGRLRRERSRGRGPAYAYREGQDARFEVAVIGDDRPANGIRTVRKPVAHRYDERPSLDVWAAAEHRPPPVPDRLDN